MDLFRANVNQQTLLDVEVRSMMHDAKIEGVSVELFGCVYVFFFFQAEDGIRDYKVTGVQTCALPISESYTEFGKAVDGPAPNPGRQVFFTKAAVKKNCASQQDKQGGCLCNECRLQ